MMMLTGNDYVCSRCGTDSENPDKCFRCDEPACQHPNMFSGIIHFCPQLVVAYVECPLCQRRWICDSH